MPETVDLHEKFIEDLLSFARAADTLHRSLDKLDVPRKNELGETLGLEFRFILWTRMFDDAQA